MGLARLGQAAAPMERPATARGGPVSYAIFRVARSHRALARRLLQTVGLYPGQEMLMMHLWETGPQRVTDLVTVLDGDPATVTRMVARLEKTGFVRRTAGSVDRRTTIVESTEAGHALRAEVERLWRQLEQETVSGLDADQQAAALCLLSKLEAHLAETITS